MALRRPFSAERLEKLGRDAAVELERFGSQLVFAIVIAIVGFLLISYVIVPIVSPPSLLDYLFTDHAKLFGDKKKARWLLLNRKMKPTVANFVVTSLSALLKFLVVFTCIDLLGVESE